MAKKVLGGLDAMIGGAAAPAKTKTEASALLKRSPGRPRKYEEPGQLPEDEERASIIVKKATWEKFKALGYWERRKQKTLLDDILSAYLSQWEKKHGEVKPVPADADR